MVANIGHNGGPVATVGELRWAIWNSDEPLYVKALALCIVEHMGRGKPWSNPSKARLARLCSVSVKTVDRYINRIEKFLCVERRTGQVNIYHARIAEVAAELDSMLPTPSESSGDSSKPTPQESMGCEAEPNPSESPTDRPPVSETPGLSVPTPPPDSPEPTDSQGVQTLSNLKEPEVSRAHTREATPKDEDQEEVKPEEPKKPKKESAKRAHRMPEGWQPKEQTLHWARNGTIGATDDQIREQLEHFRDHAAANGKRFVDWDKAFQTWMRNAKEWGRIKGDSRRSTERPPDIPEHVWAKIQAQKSGNGSLL